MFHSRAGVAAISTGERVVAELGYKLGTTVRLSGEHIIGQAAGRGRAICVTQPRRVAAISTAERVAAELGCEVGTTVGYQVDGRVAAEVDLAVFGCTAALST